MSDVPPRPHFKVVELDDHVARIATEHLRAGGGVLRASPRLRPAASGAPAPAAAPASGSDGP